MKPEIQLQMDRGKYRFKIDGVAWDTRFWSTPEKALLEAAYWWANRPKRNSRAEFLKSEAHQVGQYGEVRK